MRLCLLWVTESQRVSNNGDLGFHSLFSKSYYLAKLKATDVESTVEKYYIICSMFLAAHILKEENRWEFDIHFSVEYSKP